MSLAKRQNMKVPGELGWKNCEIFRNTAIVTGTVITNIFSDMKIINMYPDNAESIHDSVSKPHKKSLMQTIFCKPT